MINRCIIVLLCTLTLISTASASQCFVYQVKVYSLGTTVPDPEIGTPESMLTVQPFGCGEEIPYSLQQGQARLTTSQRFSPFRVMSFSVLGLPVEGDLSVQGCPPTSFLHRWQAVSLDSKLGGSPFNFAMLDFVTSVTQIFSSDGIPQLLITEVGELYEGGVLFKKRSMDGRLERYELVEGSSTLKATFNLITGELNGNAKMELCFEKS